MTPTTPNRRKRWLSRALERSLCPRIIPFRTNAPLRNWRPVTPERFVREYLGVGEYVHDSHDQRCSGHTPFMVACVEIITCLAAIAGCLKLTCDEYNRMRKNRQLNQALRFAVGDLA